MLTALFVMTLLTGIFLGILIAVGVGIHLDNRSAERQRKMYYAQTTRDFAARFGLTHAEAINYLHPYLNKK